MCLFVCFFVVCFTCVLRVGGCVFFLRGNVGLLQLTRAPCPKCVLHGLSFLVCSMKSISFFFVGGECLTMLTQIADRADKNTAKKEFN